MTPFMSASVLVVLHMCYVRGQSPCTTPSGAGGSCISINDCSELMTMAKHANKSQQDIELLRSSHCGYDTNVPKVCCPTLTQNDKCFTPDGHQGTCVSIHSCQHLADMLKPPVSKDSVAFLRNSRCNSSERYSVCCGPPPSPTPAPGPHGVCTMTAAPPDPQTKCCGEAASGPNRFASSEAAIDQYPWLVLIEYVKNNSISLQCGGALISGRYVLTAGHCVVGPVLDAGTPINVRLGEYDTANDGMDCVEVPGGGQDCTDGVTLISIEEVIVHPEYDSSASQRRHDIALLRLRKLAPYTDFIRPICLPTTDVTVSPDILYLYAAGWGTGGPRQSSINKRNRKVCQSAYSVPGRNFTLWQGQLCAGGREMEDCKGDSGGPLMFEYYRNVEVIGIASFSPTCSMENTPSVYTNVLEYNSWIRSQIRP